MTLQYSGAFFFGNSTADIRNAIQIVWSSIFNKFFFKISA